jgi:hypothetical protein
MNDLQIIVNDTPLDLFENSDFYVTEQVHDLFDLQTRNASFARTLEVPATDKNRMVLQNSFPSFDNQVKSVVRLPCKILFGGVHYVNNGEVSAVEQLEDVISLEFSFSSFSFFEKLTGKFVSELDWSDLDFTFDLAGWESNATQTKDLVTSWMQWFNSENLIEQEVYAFSDFRTVHNLDQSGFNLYLKDIARRIIEQNGLIFDDTLILNEIDWDRLTLVCTVDKFLFEEPVVLGTVEKTIDQIENAPMGSPLTARISFDNVITDKFGYWDAFNNEFVITDNYARLEFSLSVNVSYIAQATSNQITLTLYKNGIVVRQIFKTNSQDFTGSLSIVIPVIAADILHAELSIEQQDDATLFAGAQLEIQAIQAIDRNIAVSDYIPEIEQGSFLQSLAAYFNAIISTDEIAGVVQLIPYNDLFNNPEKDITQFADVGKEEEKIYVLPYFQQSEFKYKDSDIRRDDVNAIFNFGTNNILPLAGTLVEIGFEASDNSIWESSMYLDMMEVSSYVMATIKPTAELYYENAGPTLQPNEFRYYVEGTDVPRSDPAPTEVKVGDYIESHAFTGTNREAKRVATVTNDGVGGTIEGSWLEDLGGVGVRSTIYQFERGNEGAIRIGRRSDLPTNHSIWYNDDNNSQSVLGFDTNFETSMLWSNLLTNNYQNLLNRLQNPFVLRAWFRFSPSQFQELDLGAPVYLQQYAMKFVINKAEQFDPRTGLSRLELIRI